MVLPLADDNTGRRTIPVVNYVLIALNVLVFVLFQGMGNNERFTMAFSTVPEEIVTGHDRKTPDQTLVDQRTGQRFTVPGLQPTPVPVYFTLITSMFMHGGWMHLLGNMWFLWIFGDNVEDDLGHVRYVFFYLTSGVFASLAHIAATYSFGGNPLIPVLGASGAISGVLGAYIVQHPHRRVTVLLFRVITQVPGYVAIGIWFLFQLMSGLTESTGIGGVAYGAHIGGFIVGVLFIKPFLPRPGPDAQEPYSIPFSRT